MPSNISFNPSLTTNAAGGFGVSSAGFVQGIAFDDPSVRNALAGAPLASTETVPMWGGIPITENIPSLTADSALGGQVARATAVANITGFSVINQAAAWITSPQSQAPTAGAGMTVPFYRLGSGARIAVKCDPSLAGALDGGAINQQFSWDFNNSCLQPYDAATATVSLTSITSSYAAGLYTFAVVAAAATLVGAVGDAINVSGVTGTGAALVNGNQVVTAFTDNQHFSFQIAAGAGAIATGALGGTLILNQGVGALTAKILQINPSNSKIVVYDPVNNVANWMSNGCAAIILI